MRSPLLVGLGMVGSLVGWADPSPAAELVELRPYVVDGGLWGGGAAVQAGQLGELVGLEPRVDLVSRGGDAYQVDLHIRGGIFSGSGVSVGGISLLDPQTGHYFGEIPLDPGHLGALHLRTGLEHGLGGLQSTSGELSWSWGKLETGQRIDLIAGTDSYLGGGWFGTETGDGWGAQAGIRHEEGDGSVANGDFRLQRVSARVDVEVAGGVLRAFGGYVDKYYGWPGMYTGFASLAETEDYQIGLAGLQWERVGATGERHRLGMVWRNLRDDYEFNRSEPGPFFEHETEVLTLEGDGGFRWGSYGLRYHYSLARDELVESTSLTEGDFRTRQYAKAGAVGERRWALNGSELAAYGGMTMDSSNRESTVGQPQAGLRWHGRGEAGDWEAFVEWSESSRVPGYTALKSPESGLFGGNASLGRERARTLQSGLSFVTERGQVRVVIFEREEEDLVDWVYDAESPSARQAAPLDGTVRGLEVWASREWGPVRGEVGYAYLDKEMAYQAAGVDASYYALNYARHRITGALEAQPKDGWTVRVEGRWREHAPNVLRSSGDESLRWAAELRWSGFPAAGWQWSLRGENLGEDDFEDVPGTPAPGRSLRLVVRKSF